MSGFNEALLVLKDGGRVHRHGWNGKGMWLCLVSTWSATIHHGWLNAETLSPFIAMRTADGKIVPWLASQTDILADDWCLPYVPYTGAPDA